MGFFDRYSDVVGGKKGEDKKTVDKPTKKEEASAVKQEGVFKWGGAKKEQVAKKFGGTKTGGRKQFNPLSSLIKVGAMVRKDLRLLVRSKTSALIVLFGPLAIILLVGLAFSGSSLYNIRIATYSDGYSDLSNSVIATLQDQQYSIIRTDSLEICQRGVKYGDFHLCVVFPKDLQIGSQENTVQIHVDQSRLNLASLISSAIAEKVSAKSTEVGINLTTDILNVLDNTKNSIEARIKTVNELISDNSDSTLKIKTSEEELNKIDLSYNESEVNFSDVSAKITAIVSKYNVSLTMSNNLKDAVNDMESSVNTLHAKLSEADKSKVKTIGELASIRGMLTTSLSELNMLRGSLNDIGKDIGSIKLTDAGLIVEPIKTSIEPITKEKKHLSFLFPTMIVLVIMFISILLSSTIVIREKLSAAYFRNFITPTSDLLYMFGTYLTNMIIVMVQLGILFVASLYFFKDQLVAIAANLCLVVLIVTSAFILIGMIIGYLFKTEETSTLAAISVSSILLFFSNTILPVESLPNTIRNIVKYNPFVISESVVRKILLFGAELNSIASSVYILLSMIAILIVVCYVAREMTKRSI